MKLQTTTRVVEMDGIDAPIKKFSIKNSAKAFQVLSNNLYSDKPMAVLRELGCNAYDAHIAAGTADKPFDVHLPNNFEPFFSIRDYGTGLSEEQVMNIYTTYFESTKGDENDSIGCLGLGSKSPFSYVDQFTVISYYKGSKVTYTAFIAEEGSPSIMKTFEEKTDEPNGLEIYMLVEASDFQVFAERAKTVFFRFPTLPNLKGNRSADLTQVKYILEGPNYKLRDASMGYQYSFSRDSGCAAVQGVVAYPINVGRISLPMTDKQKRLLQYMPVDIYFPIGELDIAPSREELSYDKVTQQNIINAVQSVIDHVPKFATDILATANTEWEAKVLYGAWLNNNSNQSRFMKEVLNDKLLWNGKEIKDNNLRVYTYDIDAAKKIKDLHINSFDCDSVEESTRKLKDLNIEKFGDCAYYPDRMLRSNSGRSRVKAGYYVDIKIDVTDDTVIILLDDPKLSRRITAYIQHNYNDKDKNVYVFRVDVTNHDHIIKQLGGCPSIIYASSLEEPPPEVKDPTVVKRDIRKLYQVTGYHEWCDPPFNMNETNHDVATGGYYAVMYNKQLIKPGHEFEEKVEGVVGGPPCGGEINKLVYLSKRLGLLKDASGAAINLFAFNSSHKHLVKSNPGWINLYDLMKEKIAQLDKDKMLYLATHYYMMKHVPVYKEIVDHHKALNKIEFAKKNSKLYRYLAQANKIIEEVSSIANQDNDPKFDLANNEYNPNIEEFFTNAKEVLKVKVPDLSKAKEIGNKFEQEIKRFYPLIQDLLSNRSFEVGGYEKNSKVENNKKLFAHYINLCDACPTLVSTVSK